MTDALYLVNGAAIDTSSISLNPPLPSRLRVLEPVIKITGDRSPQASIIAGTALAKPSGPTRQTVGLRVIRVFASAKCPAICSWGVLITGIPHSINPSRAGLQNPPLRVNTRVMPFSRSARASSIPPRTFMSISPNNSSYSVLARPTAPGSHQHILIEMRNVCTADLRHCQKHLVLQHINETEHAALAVCTRRIKKRPAKHDKIRP